mmetsp:Transcript_29962/g.92443  ORF Transcript_29962/g.92443 Transcript_29962/m.92443 type:complete len:206 (+) Transcript_29962:82-699(+)
MIRIAHVAHSAAGSRLRCKEVFRHGIVYGTSQTPPLQIARLLRARCVAAVAAAVQCARVLAVTVRWSVEEQPSSVVFTAKGVSYVTIISAFLVFRHQTSARSRGLWQSVMRDEQRKEVLVPGRGRNTRGGPHGTHSVFTSEKTASTREKIVDAIFPAGLIRSRRDRLLEAPKNKAIKYPSIRFPLDRSVSRPSSTVRAWRASDHH